MLLKVILILKGCLKLRVNCTKLSRVLVRGLHAEMHADMKTGIAEEAGFKNSSTNDLFSVVQP